ncbi:MAG: dTMP kinase [Myxococcota bacterium]
MLRTSSAGLLVVLEGIDGAGKTTLRDGLARRAQALGHEVVCTKEPTDGPLGQQIRALARAGRESVSPEEELRLFHEDRQQHVETLVLPALARGAVVLQDRSYFSTVAYQGERGLDRARLRALEESIAPVPDLLLVLDLPAEVSLARVAKRGASDDFESLASLRRVREVFLGFEGKHVIDATQGPDRMLDQAWALVAPRLSTPTG